MAVETVDDIAEEIADKLGIYGAHIDAECDFDFSWECRCRSHFVSGLTARMRQAAEVERKLAAA